MIGAIGSRRLTDVILFEVSSSKILTLNNLRRTNRVRFAKHDTLLRKPVSQYVGLDLHDLDFDIVLKAWHGVSPQAEFERLARLQDMGAALSVVLGRRAVGAFRWRIDHLGIPYEKIDNRGNCISSTVGIRLEEYW